MVEFGGWEMPVQYAGIIDEHHHTRAAASAFDICHMGEFMIRGSGAASFLGRMITSDVQSMPVGRCKYGLLLNDAGCILDDLIAYRLDHDEYMLVVNAATTNTDLAWMQDHATPEVTIEDLSDRTAKIDLQGPESSRVMRELCGIDLADLKYFSWRRIKVGDTEVLISRTGYTGEDGFELYADSDAACTLWDSIISTGVHPAGLGARDTLRLEAGLPLSGQDIGPADNPVQANMSRFLQLDKDFIGKDALPTGESVDRLLIGFELDGRRAARHGNRIVDLKDGKDLGYVTSGSFCPSLGKAVGMAYTKPSAAHAGTEFAVDTGRVRLQARAEKLPFYRRSHGGI